MGPLAIGKLASIVISALAARTLENGRVDTKPQIQLQQFSIAAARNH